MATEETIFNRVKDERNLSITLKNTSGSLSTSSQKNHLYVPITSNIHDNSLLRIHPNNQKTTFLQQKVLIQRTVVFWIGCHIFGLVSRFVRMGVYDVVSSP